MLKMNPVGITDEAIAGRLRYMLVFQPILKAIPDAEPMCDLQQAGFGISVDVLATESLR